MRKFGYWTIALPLLLASCAQSPNAGPQSPIAPPQQVSSAQPTTQPESQQRLPAGTEVHRDLAYVPDGHARQRLDLYLPPARSGKVPVVVWIHGGGWSSGSKARPAATRLLDRGYAVASVGYRLTDTATAPAQINDCAAAIRFLRGNADRFGIDADHIGVWGASAGGNLALLIGVGADVAPLQGGEGGFNALSSRVNCVIDYFGTVEFRNPKQFPINENRIKYLGGLPEERPEIAALVTPITHVTPDDAPTLIVHGDADNTVPINHSQAMAQAFAAAGVTFEFVTVPGGKHGGEAFATPDVNAKVDAFLDRYLKPKPGGPERSPARSN
ncbi:MAG TPA: alpha/beta hydrolase [Tepidisphaeraceae bacterium]|nr:alpha/beta hydrolase [Tepidisphaeraceae bacterium]